MAPTRSAHGALANTQPGRLVVTFYRHGPVLGCADHACRQHTPWSLRGPIVRRTVRYNPVSETVSAVRAPRNWAIATLQLTQPGTRPGLTVALLPPQVHTVKFRHRTAHLEAQHGAGDHADREQSDHHPAPAA
ncbi:hypothetical protein [Capillimicrobium parvum]|uniref:Uncharacterized protein n=1 Tax=Capillimicrobium parvum TaxID=2884022 RepID=A0A9E7C273_9ACTN|nr:hypothetical protein [Capillimicrobium parvum]UGS37153.1 hypothetical protein DSM104329_03568 [Capillimicrobium parvum]